MTVLLCETRSKNDTGIGFGGFLLNEGEIDEYDLERALRYQRVEHVAIGALAVREKYLSERQLCDVKGHQRERGGLFGEIAIELGLLSERCVNVLLMMQKENNRRIGEILVMLGSVNRDEHYQYLIFRRFMRRCEKDLTTLKIRGGIFMTDAEDGAEHRTTERVDLALQISTQDQEGKTINISASGVYFEIVTSDINAFSPGTTVPIKIDAVTNTPGCDERNVKLHGQGLIVRNEIKDVTSTGNRLGIALEFKGRLEVLMDES